MREDADAPLAVTFPLTIAGLLRGRDLGGAGTLSVRADAIELRSGGRAVLLPFAMLDGAARLADDAVDLYASSGDVLHLSDAPELGAIARSLTARICTLPELTLSLRALGARGRAGRGTDHDRFFAPLLDARRRGEGARGTAGVVQALDARELRAALTATLRDFTVERFATQEPDRRSLEAELEESAAPVFDALDVLERTQRELVEADDTTRYAMWRAWAAAVRALFERADACWAAICPVLLDCVPQPPRPFWRRWLGLTGVVAVVLVLLAKRAGT